MAIANWEVECTIRKQLSHLKRWDKVSEENLMLVLNVGRSGSVDKKPKNRRAGSWLSRMPLTKNRTKLAGTSMSVSIDITGS